MLEKVDTLEFQRTIFSFLAGAFLAYCILLVWIGTTLFFIISLERLSCSDIKNSSKVYSDLLSGLDVEALFEAIDTLNVTSGTNTMDVRLGESEFFQRMEKCQELFDRDYGFILNITFGLVTAAVVAQLGSSKSNSKSSLNKRFEPYMLSYLRSVEIRKYELEFMELGGANMVVSRCDRFQLNAKVWVLYFVLWSPQIYVFCWILVGLGCLLYGSFYGESIAGPIFSTGQTCLGVAMTTTYVYFGVNKGDDSDEDDSEKKPNDISTEDDKETVLSAVKSNGMALQYASEELRADKEVVEAAVASSGMALQYASGVLKNDQEVVLAAVKSNGMALEYASPKCRRNKNIIEAATRTHPGALKFVSLEDEEQSNEEVMASEV